MATEIADLTRPSPEITLILPPSPSLEMRPDEVVARIEERLDALARLRRPPAAAAAARSFLTDQAAFQRWRATTNRTLQEIGLSGEVERLSRATAVTLPFAMDEAHRFLKSLALQVAADPALLEWPPTPTSGSDHSDDPFIAELSRLAPSAAAAFLQAVEDLKTSRRSYRGPANELRQALWDILQTLAPDEAVTQAPGYRAEPGTKGPTHRQRAAVIMKQRRGEQPPASVLAAIDAISTLTRETYTRSSRSTHTQQDREEAEQLRRYVEVVLRDLLLTETSRARAEEGRDENDISVGQPEIGFSAEDIARLYLEATWRPLASYAWRRHLECGRKGAVVIPWAAAQSWARGEIRAFSPRFIVSMENEPFEEYVDRYDPQLEIVAMFVGDTEAKALLSESPGTERNALIESKQPEGHFLLFIARFEPPPPEAARARAN